jgi:uncharacterized protein YcfJ
MEFSMKSLIAITFAAILSMFSTTAFAGYDDVATILNVTPIMGVQIQNQQVCSQVAAQSSTGQDRSAAGSIIGGIAGALLGNQVGNGRGRAVATAVGAIAGSVTGDRVDNRQQYPTASQQQYCRIEQTSVAKITGYSVTFEFGRRTYQSNMQYDPTQSATNTLRVSVSVLPK